ncbi:CDP-glycerol glycerophosphotransferase family protein [Oceaniserpentilla sp. 4NH20-0058]|uniref:CDP-glycerol glycerophosphotransferase family protein n=1 Tax=Oceaniserpentilla sp. 4NH20-0058 TaxID=3127660 RepID=UPI0033415D64
MSVIERCLELSSKVKLVIYKSNIDHEYRCVFDKLKVDLVWVEDDYAALNTYKKEKPDWILFGNSFKFLSSLSANTKTAQLGHGIGPKPSYYHKSSTPMTVRFMEGDIRLSKIQSMFPDDTFIQVGYSKLDPVFNGLEKGLNLADLALNPEKKTILYAPTFNPSSLECFPDDWPLDFAEFNILIKPHSFTYTIDQYAGQREKLKKWASYENVYVAGPEELSLLPHMVSADILLSEASSTLFEFVALDKPVVVCDFYKLKWSYRGIFHFRFKKRFGTDNVLYKDIGPHVNSYKKLREVVLDELNCPETYKAQRAQYTRDHVGPIDGLVSKRIVDYLIENA